MEKEPSRTKSYKLIIKKFLPLTIFLAAVAAIFIIYGRDMLNIFSKPENIKSYIESKGRWGVFIYIALQILQIIIAVIPGEPIQIAGGYIYGTFKGFLYAEIGIMAGSAIAFFIARKFGIPIIRLFVSENKLMHYKEKLESKKGLAITFILCLIPGIPKDVLVYASGLTPISYRLFFFLYFIARMPAIFGASYMGAALGNENYGVFIALAAGAVVLIILGFVFKDKIYALMKKYEE